MTFYYAGNQEKNHRNGVGILVHTVKNFVHYSDRIVLLKIRSKPVFINIIQEYAPKLKKSTRKSRKPANWPNQIKFNTKRFQREGETVEKEAGPFKLRERNSSEDCLEYFGQEEQFKIINTCFSLPTRKS